MSKKRTSLEAVLGTVTVPPSPPEKEKKPRQPPKKKPPVKVHKEEESRGARPLVKQQTAYLPLPVYEQLRHLAFEEKSKMHDYLMEGLDRVFKDRGLKSLRELTRIRV